MARPFSRPDPEHQRIVDRRLELLRAELARDSRVAGDLPETRVERAGASPAASPDSAQLLPSRRLGGLIPEPLRGLVSLQPSHLVVVVLLIAAGLVVTCWWVVKSSASPDLTPVAVASSTPLVTAQGQPGKDASTGATGMVVVDVEGRVRKPGVKRLPSGSRVIDAIKAAGGVRRHRDLGGINLAAVLTDGQQIVAGGGSRAGPTTASTDGGLVDLNTADATALDTLPDVGPVTAQAILDWREENGRFTSVDELLEVEGIGDATLDKIRPHVTVQ